MIDYSVSPLKVTDKCAFTEASKEELRVLLALIEIGGTVNSEDELAKLAGTSRARCSSALVFWQEAGVIGLREHGEPNITEEFERRIESGEIAEESSLKTAKTIRDGRLADMITECTAILGQSSLSTADVKKLTGLYEQYQLSPEYIVTLLAYMKEHGKINITRLVNKATNLDAKGIDTLEDLERYISERESESEADFAFRKIFGIYGRSPSKSESEAFAKWSKTYGYFTEIVGEAYDIAVSKVSRGFVNYADKILTRWYECGCRTLAQCRAQYESDESERKEKYEQAKKERTAAAKSPAKKERYGEFDPEKAFMKALERSYGKKDGE